MHLARLPLGPAALLLQQVLQARCDLPAGVLDFPAGKLADGRSGAADRLGYLGLANIKPAQLCNQGAPVHALDSAGIPN